MDKCQKIFFSLAEKQGAIICKDEEEKLKVSQVTAILTLRDMVKGGMLLKEECSKKRKYRVAGWLKMTTGGLINQNNCNNSAKY